MRKRTSVAFLAVLGLLLFGCGKKTTQENTTTKAPTPVVTTTKPTTTEKQVTKYTVTVVNSIQNAGTVSGTGEIEEGKSTTLKATPADGYTFVGFFDGETKLTDESEYTITVNKNVSLTAKWTAKSYNLTVERFSNVDPEDVVKIDDDDDSLGTVEYVNEHEGVYQTGEVITLTATPKTGYQFNGWYLFDAQEGDHWLSSDETYEFHMLPQNSTIKAIFGTKKCEIEIIANNIAAVSELSIANDDTSEEHNFDPSSDPSIEIKYTFDYGTTVNIYGVEASGYTFQGFYLLDENGEYNVDDILSTDTYFTAYDSAKYLAYFTTNDYKLTVSQNIEDAGTITIEPENEQYAFLSTVTITTTVNDGFTFDGWYSSNTYSEETRLSDSDEVATTLVYQLTNAYDTIIYAKYTAAGVQFNFEVIGSEEVEGETVYWGSVNESKLYDYDTTLTLKATPTNGHVFNGWYLITIDPDTQEEVETLISPNSTYDYIIDSLTPRNIRAKFVCGEYNFCGHTNITDSDFCNDDEDCPYNLIINQTDNTSYVYGSEVTLVAPTVTGFTFVGWYIADQGYEDEDISGLQFVSTNATWTFTFIYYDCPCLTACYTRNTYNIIYSTDGSTGGEVGKTVTYGLDYQLVVPTLTGKNFAGWYYVDTVSLKKVFLTDYQGNSLAQYHIANAVTVQAEWLTAQAIVTFNTDGGSTIDSQTIDYNTKATRPAQDPEKDGHTFVDWYDSEGNVWSFTANLITENTTIYAHWTINQYEIALVSANNAAVVVNSDDIDGTYNYNTLLKITATVQPGYTFAGWYEGTKLVSSSASYDYVLPSRDVTLTATYTVNSYTISISLLRVSGFVNISKISVSTGAGNTFKYGSDVTITTTLDNASHYLWRYYTNMDGTWKYYMDNGAYVTDNPLSFKMPARNFSLYIYINSNSKNLDLTKSSNTGIEGTVPYFTIDASGTGHYNSEPVAADRIVNIHAYDIDGYTFTGWYVKDTDTLISNQKDYQFNMTYEDLYYEARYIENNYTLTLNRIADDNIDETDDTTLINNYSVTYKTDKTCSVSAMTGYTFLGWYDSSDDSLVSSDLSFDYTMPKENVTLEARFEINQYQVYITTYMSNTDYNLEPATWNYKDDSHTDYDYNTKITYTVTANAGWTFLGYYGIDGNVSFNRTNFNNGAYALICETTTFEFTVPAKDYTIFPMFKANTYNIIYNENGGEISADGKPVLMGDDFELDVPTFTGKDFLGWRYTDTETLQSWYLTDEFGASLEVYNLPMNIQVKAIYGNHPYTVTFETGFDASTYDENDTKAFTQKVEFGANIVKPTDPTRKGYTFTGWFTEEDETGAAWNFATDTMGNADRTLYAHWTINSYTIKMYHVNGNTGSFTYSVAGTTISGTVAANVTGSSPVTITVNYNSKITLSASFHIGRKINYWAYRTENVSSNTSLGNDTTITVTDNFAANIYIVLYSIYVDEMKYFNFTSTTNTCTINSVVSTYYTTTTLTVPDYVTSISAGTFKNCTGLTTLVLPYTGISTSATGMNRTVMVLFGTSNITGTTARTAYYWNGSALTEGSTYYVPTNLKTVTITNDTTVYPCAFASLGLYYVNINDGITTIGEYAFYKNLLIPTSSNIFKSTVTTLKDYSFFECNTTAVFTMVVPATVTTIGKGMLGNTAVQKLTIPFIGKSKNATGSEAVLTYLFAGSTKWCTTITQQYGDNTNDKVTGTINIYLTTVIMNGDSALPQYGAFMNDTYLTSFSLSKGSSNNSAIRPYTFYGCTKLTSIDSYSLQYLASIGKYAFYNTSSLKIEFNAKLYSNYLYINEYAFYYSGITKFIVTKNNSQVTVYTKTRAFQNCTGMTDFTVVNTTGSNYLGLNGDYSFLNCTALTSLTFNGVVQGPDKTTEAIGTFDSCTALTTAEFGNMVYVGDYMFNNCTSFSSISFNINPNSTGYNFYRTVGFHAFFGTVITDLNLSWAKSLDEHCLENMPSLKTLKVPFIGKDASGNTTSTSSNYTLGYLFGTTSYSGHTARTMYTSLTATTSYYIPTNLLTLKLYITTDGTIIGESACRGVSSIRILQVDCYDTSYTYKIGRNAFRQTGIGNGQSTTSLQLGYGLTYIGASAFYDLYVKAFNIPDTCTTIGSYAFYNNSLNTYTVTLPSNSNLTINEYAFASNSISSLTIKNFKAIYNNAFQYNNLTTITFSCGSNMGEIYAEAFFGNTNSSLTATANVTTTVFDGFIQNGKLKSNWNLLKTATSSSAAVYLKSVTCTNGTYTIN